MKIKELIKNFEEECLFGENRFRNIILYDNLLDKIEREENMQWNLENIRSYLSIIWYRLKNECPNVRKRYFSVNKEYSVLNKEEKISVQPYGEDKDGLIAVFNTNLKNKYQDYIYCLFIKDGDSKFMELKNVDSFYPFCTKDELSILLTEKTIDDNLKTMILALRRIIEQDFKNKLPSIGLKPKDFSCENLYIKINESQPSVYIDKDKHPIDSSKATRKERILQTDTTKIMDVEKKLRGGKNTPESKLSGWDHIIIDGSDNLPLSLLNMIFDKKYHYIDKYKMQVDIIEKNGVYDFLKNIIQKAINRSLKRASEKYYIASSYYIEQNKISYLLPLFISQREKPDCVLVFNETNDGEYVGNTLLNMDEARTNTRVLDKIDNYKWMF